MDKINLEKLTTFTYNGDTNKYIYPGSNWTYKIILDQVYDVDKIINISYFGSGLTYDTDYMGPKQIIIKTGTDRLSFNIDIHINDNVYEKDFIVTATLDFGTPGYEQSIVNNRTVPLAACPWYITPKIKIQCEPMIGLPTEYQNNFCEKSDTYRYTGPECKDIYFWDLDGCIDAFINSPPLYKEE